MGNKQLTDKDALNRPKVKGFFQIYDKHYTRIGKLVAVDRHNLYYVRAKSGQIFACTSAELIHEEK